MLIVRSLILTGEKMSDMLNEMTKAELVSWIREGVFNRRPRKSWLLFHRWKVGMGKLEAEEDAEMLIGSKIDLKQRDEYAHRCNATSDSKEKLKWLNLMSPYDKAFREHLNRDKKLRAKRKKLDRMYNKMDTERDRERGEP